MADLATIVVESSVVQVSITVDPQIIAIVEVGILSPPPGSGIAYFATTAIMFATTGSAGQIAYCMDYPDQHWKWSLMQNTWIPSSL